MQNQDGVTAPLPQELFHYSPAHEILICTSCRYAIQPGAVTRHLKEIHHIFRNKRHPYIKYTSSLKLRQPEEVRIPNSDEFPVPHLPLEWGWQCRASGCDYLCISTKRMERHWSSVHGQKGDPSSDWSAAPLQTFFRGNMLRYFTSSESLHIRKLQDKYKLDAVDSRILKHYFDTSYKSFVTNDQTDEIWLDVVPGLAYSHLYLLRGILACTALHMAHLEPEQCQKYTVRAYSHQDSALPSFRYAIDHPSDENCDTIIAFAYLLVVYSFATDAGNTSNSLLIINDNPEEGTGQYDILPQWLYFIRTGCYMLYNVWDKIESGPASTLASAWEVKLDTGNEELPYLDYFLSIIPYDGSWSEDVMSIYHRAATTLAESFSYLERARLVSRINTWSILGTWPARVDSAFINLLSQQRHPATLILLAYYCVILKEMEKFWYFRGRPARLVISILAMLDRVWHPYIQEAVAIVINTGTEETL